MKLIEALGAAVGAAELDLPPGLTFSQAVRWVRANDSRSLAQRFAQAQTAHVLAYAIGARAWNGSSSAFPSWPEAIRAAKWFGPVETAALVRFCKSSGIAGLKHGSHAFGTPTYIAPCHSCGRFFYLNDVRRTTCNGCRVKAERDKKRRQRGTDLSPRPCSHCGATFTPKRSTAQFCSTACRVASHRKKSDPQAE